MSSVIILQLITFDIVDRFAQEEILGSAPGSPGPGPGAVRMREKCYF